LLVSGCIGVAALGMVISLFIFTLPICCHSLVVTEFGSSISSLEEDLSWWRCLFCVPTDGGEVNVAVGAMVRVCR
jgi:ABC-type lipoprotein release transport system permease subunit